MYPTIVIVLVNSHRTFDQMYFINSSLPPISRNMAEPIAFALPNNTSSTSGLSEQVEIKNNPQVA
jgi:hypothetical protein